MVQVEEKSDLKQAALQALNFGPGGVFNYFTLSAYLSILPRMWQIHKHGDNIDDAL